MVDDTVNMPDAPDLFSLVENFIGKSWLEEELKQKEPHPLAFWYKKTKEDYDTFNKTGKGPFNEQTFYFIQFAKNLGKVMNVIDKDRFRERLRDNKKFEKVSYEIQIATKYIDDGYNVTFVKEGELKTPDLKIQTKSGTVYVECKKKDQATARDIEVQTIWEEVSRRLSEKMNILKLNYSFNIFSDSDPLREDIDYLVEEISKLLLKHFVGQVKIGKFRVVLQKTTDYDLPLEANKISFRLPINLDYSEPQFEVMAKGPHTEFQTHAQAKFQTQRFPSYLNVSIQSDEDLLFRNFRFFGFKSANEPDRIKGIIEAFEDAYEQIPPSGPGIIYIDIFIYPSPVQQDLIRLDQMINGKLNVIHRVNAVVLTTSFFVKEKEKLSLRGIHKIIYNKNPKTILPNNFVI